MADSLVPARLGVRDLVRVGGAGLRTRPLRVFLSALGIAIGIAAMIAVVGISTSSSADLQRQLAALGTNLLRVGPGQDFFGGNSHLPDQAVEMVSRIGPVTSATAIGRVSSVHAYRTDKIPTGETNGIGVFAARTDLLSTVGATLANGTWLNAATIRYPAVVLGADTASRLGITLAGPDIAVWLGGHWFTVVGVLNKVPLAAELDSAALVGWPVAQSLLAFDGYRTTIFTR